MKILFTILIVFTSRFLAYSQSGSSMYELTIGPLKQEKTNTMNFLMVPVTLINNSKDTLKYLSMSCSWEEFYIIDNNGVFLEIVPCTRNFPIELKLAPKKGVSTELKLVFKQNTDSKISFKIGMNLLKVDHSVLETYSEYKKKSTKNIIWSNTILQFEQNKGAPE